LSDRFKPGQASVFQNSFAAPFRGAHWKNSWRATIDAGGCFQLSAGSGAKIGWAPSRVTASQN